MKTLLQTAPGEVLQLFLALILAPLHQLQIGQQGGQRRAEIVGHGGDQLGVGGAHLLLRFLMGQNGPPHLLDSLGQLSQLVHALYGNGVVEIPTGQNVQLLLQLLDIPQLSVDKNDKAN